jgi:hypothetical protein
VKAVKFHLRNSGLLGPFLAAAVILGLVAVLVGPHLPEGSGSAPGAAAAPAVDPSAAPAADPTVLTRV